MATTALVHAHSWPAVRRGGERYLHDLAWYLTHHTSVTPYVLTRWGRPRLDRVEGVPVHRGWMVPPTLPRRLRGWSSDLAAGTARRAVAARPADLVHCLDPHAARGAAAARRTTVYTVLGAPNREFARRHPRAWAEELAGIRAADLVTAVGSAAADGIADASGRDVVALPPGLRTHQLQPRLAPRTGPPRILFASAVEPRNKGFAHLVRAMRRIVASHPDAVLEVVGPGRPEVVLSSLGSDADAVRPHLRHRPTHSDEMPDRYRDATVTVLASFGEAFGLVLAESLACGTPVVASEDGGPAEIVRGAEDVVGTLTPSEDPDALADALLRAIDLAAVPTTPAACVAHARQWDWEEAVGPAHLQLYASLGVFAEVAA